jgi:HK97 family phage major capsid protein
MSAKIRELRAERVRIAEQMKALIPRSGQYLVGEDRARFDRLDAEQQRLKEEIDRLEVAERSDLLDAELRETTRPPEASIGGERRGESREEREYSTAFRAWLKNGLLPNGRSDRGISDAERRVLESYQAERRDMAEGSGSTGGYFVPQGFVYKIEEALKFCGQMFEASTIMDTATGQPLPWPNDNDTTISGEQINENTQVTTQDVTLGSITFNAYKYSTKLVKVSLELLQDSAFDFENYLARKFAIRLGRILNNKFTVGAGTTEPNGIVTAAAAGPTAVGSAANTGNADSATNTVGSIDVVELEHSVDVLYRRGASYMMHDTTLKYLKEILDKYGRPLWKPGLSSGDPDRINGYPYFLNNDMAQLGASNKTVLFGDLTKYVIRRVKSLQVLRLSERFADYGQVAFVGFARYDGNLLDAGTHPVKYLIQYT